MVAATAARGRRLGAGPRPVLRDLRPVEDSDPELLRCASDECGGGGDQQQSAGDHQAGVRAEVRRQPMDAPDPGPKSCVRGDRLVNQADPSDGQWPEGPFRPVLHLKTEEPGFQGPTALFAPRSHLKAEESWYGGERKTMRL